MAVPPTLGVILAGGLSRRMGGGDKALLGLGGRTLLECVVERLAPQCAAGLVLSANGDPARFAGFPGPVVADAVLGHPGPLAGILAGLDFAADATSHPRPHPEVRGEAEARRRLPGIAAGSGGFLQGPPVRTLQDEDRDGIDVVTVSGDAPFLPVDLVERLHAARESAGTPIAVAASGDRQHFTVALWPAALRHDLREALLTRDERRVGAFIARHGAAVAAWPTTPFDPFLNVNAPDDLAAAQAILDRP